KAPVELERDRVVLIFRSIRAGKDLTEVREICAVRGAVLPVTHRVRWDLVQIRAVNQIPRVGPDITDFGNRLEPDVSLERRAPLKDAGIFQIPLIGAPVTGTGGWARRRTGGAATENIRPGHRSWTSRRKIRSEVAGIDTEKGVENRAKHRDRIHAR